MPDNFELSINRKEDRALFIANSDLFPAPAIGGFALYLQNTTENPIAINNIMVSVGEYGGVLRWCKNAAVDNIADEKQIDPIGLNGSIEAETICYKWDGENNGIAGISDGDLVKPIRVSEGYTPIHIKSTLGLFDNIALHFTPTVGTVDFECGILFSQEMIDE